MSFSRTLPTKLSTVTNLLFSSTFILNKLSASVLFEETNIPATNNTEKIPLDLFEISFLYLIAIIPTINKATPNPIEILAPVFGNLELLTVVSISSLPPGVLVIVLEVSIGSLSLLIEMFFMIALPSFPNCTLLVFPLYQLIQNVLFLLYL